MGLARAAGLPVVVVGDIDRGGVFPAFFGTVALLSADDQRLVAGFLVNKFRGDVRLLQPGLDQLAVLTGRPTLGVLPWLDGLELDVEDSLSLPTAALPGRPALGDDVLRISVARLPRLSNVTDLDALAAEPGVSVRFTRSAADVERADLVVLPGTKATVEDLGRLRADGLDVALARRAGRGDPILGLCGGYQMLGRDIADPDGREGPPGEAPGLGLLDIGTPGRIGNDVRDTNSAAPVIEGIEHVGFTEFDAHGPPARAFAVVALEVPIDAGLRDLQGHALRRPALDLLEGRPGDADQMSVVLPAEIRLEVAGVRFNIDHVCFSHHRRRPRSVSSGSTLLWPPKSIVPSSG